MKKIKVILAYALLTVIILGGLSGCGKKNEKITVVCTIFPVYDWVRSVVGDCDAVEVKLLVSDGSDLHSFQPTAKDAIAVRTADLVVRVGGDSDGFVSELIKESKVVDLRLMEAEGVTLRHTAESSEHSHDDGHRHSTDEHIWLSLKNAAACVEAIRQALSAVHPQGAQGYGERASAYIEALSALDAKYERTVAAADAPRLIFADRFPFVYLTADYGVEYAAAFEGCTTDAEAGFDTILGLSQRLEDWKLSYLCVTEASDRRLYYAVCDLLENKEIKLAVFDSMQSVKTADIESGTTYIKIMEKNLGTLSAVLGSGVTE